MEKTINIVSVKEIMKKDQSGHFYVATAVIDGTQVEALCFDGKIKTMTGEQTLDTTNKEGKWFINFPKTKGAYVGKAPYVKSPQDSALQQNSFAMSYGKDIVVALIAKGIITTEIKPTLFDLFHAIRTELLTGVPKVAEVKPNTEKDVPEIPEETNKDVIMFMKTDELGQRLLLKTLCATKGYTLNPNTDIDKLNASDRLKFVKQLLKMENKKEDFNG